MISNTNEYIEWKKDNCNKYRIKNKTEDPATIKVTSDTNDYEKTLVLEAGIETTFEVPSDGIYKVCAEGQKPDVYTLLSSGSDLTTNDIFTVFEFAGTTPIDFKRVYLGTNKIYDSEVDGTFDTGTPVIGSNLETALNAQVASLVAFDEWELVSPSSTPTITNFSSTLDTSANWRLILRSRRTIGGQFLKGGEAIYSHAGISYDVSASERCFVSFVILTFPDPSFVYIDQLLYTNPTTSLDVLSAPTTPFQKRYNQGTELTLFQEHVTSFLTTQGFTVIDNTEPFFYEATFCEDIDMLFTSIRFADFSIEEGSDISWCDFIYELCDLHACIVKKANAVYCLDCDPCQDCSNKDTTDAKKAKEDLYHISSLFFFGLIPLITQDRLNYLGDLVIDETRIDNTMKIKDIYKKLSDFVKRCGECEDDADDKDCGC